MRTLLLHYQSRLFIVRRTLHREQVLRRFSDYDSLSSNRYDTAGHHDLDSYILLAASTRNKQRKEIEQYPLLPSDAALKERFLLIG